MSSSVLALAGNWELKEKMTGLVVDCGYNKTSLVPIVDGLIISEGIEQINRGGRDVDVYIQSMMRSRKERIPQGMSLEVARSVKEHYTYTCPCSIKESERYRCNPEPFQKIYKGIDKKCGNEFQCHVGIEQFLAPEILLNPKIHNQEFNISLADAVDDCIMKCPIDTKRQLFGNIILCGGSSAFKDFHRRLQKDVKHIIESRLVASRAKAGISDSTNPLSDIMKVNVIENTAGVASVFLGGCNVASHPRFFDTCITKQLYEEEGARLFSTNMYR
jgi:actin-related protein 3